MTLYEYLKMRENDFDTCDTVYDTGVTVCYIEKEKDEYDKFCNGIIKKVDVIHIDEDCPTVNWYEMIERNIDKFKAFTKENWYEDCQYEDDVDEFIYQWINEIHQYMAGNVSMDFYTILNELVDSLE
jgi:hypothetical protein